MMRAALAFLLALIAVPGLASDHIDGAGATKPPITDISDLYAFPGPNGNSLVLAVNFYPIAPNDAGPDARASFEFLLRKATITASGFETSEEEMRVSCGFVPLSRPHSGGCAVAPFVGVKANVRQDSAEWQGQFPIFFGLRSDPFFFDADWSQDVSVDGRLPPPDGDNTMADLNVLSLIIELRRDQIFEGDFSLLAVAATSAQIDPETLVAVQTDRLGRPEITNVTLVAHGNEIDLRDEYNAQRPFTVGPHDKDHRTRIAKNIAYYDGLDGQTQWTPEETATWASLLVEDYLVVDIAAPCGADNFLEIEAATIVGQPHKTCGGRKLTDDIMDRLYGLYVNKGSSLLGDGVDAPDVEPLSEFPYLAPPSLGVGAWLKQMIAERRVR